MDRRVRKRSPLGAISPSTKKNGNKRRSSNLDDANIKNNFGNSSQSGLGSQNKNPNISNETPTKTGQSILYGGVQNENTPSQRRLSSVNLSDVGRQYGKKIEIPSQQRMTNVNSSGLLIKLQFHEFFKEIHQKKTETLSQQRMTNVNSSGLTYQTPVSRILQGNSSVQNHGTLPFQLPASRISPYRNKQTTVHSRMDKRLLESYNHDRTAKHMSPSMLSLKELQIKSKSMESGICMDNEINKHDSVRMTLPNASNIPVFVPDLEELDIRIPDWMSSHSGFQDNNCPTLTPERNLMDSFNAVENIVKGNLHATNTTPENNNSQQIGNSKKDMHEKNAGGCDTSNIEECVDGEDDADDDLEAHRGEYLSDDDADPNLPDILMVKNYH